MRAPPDARARFCPVEPSSTAGGTLRLRTDRRSRSIQPITPPPSEEAPAEPDGPPAAPRRRRGKRLAAVAGVLLVAVVLAGELIRLPYYVLSPGSATAVEPLVKVDGAPSYDHPGKVLFTTV